MTAINRVAIVFSGGPAPGANAVIAAAATSFLDEGIDVLGVFHGYTNLQEYDPATQPLIEGSTFVVSSRKTFEGSETHAA